VQAVSPDKSLAEILANRMRAGEPIPVPIVLAILRQVCDALDYAHNLRDPGGQPLGIIHRDVSPQHIFVTESGLVRLVASTTQHGTFAYMAPEYVMSGMIDARADLFALGVVAHEMLANRPLFATGDDRETLDRVCALAIPPPSSLNPHVAPDIDGIVLMALARDPAYRWQHAAMMRDGIQSVAQRLGLEVATAPHDPWGDLLAARVELAPAPPPGDPELWADDTNLETRIQPVDPALLDDAPTPVASVAAVAAPVPAPAPAPAPAPEMDPEMGPEPTQIGAMPLISFGETPLVSMIGENARRVPAPTLPPPSATFLPEAVEAPSHHRNKRIVILAILAILVTVTLVVIVLAAG
jgi:hypothetical protein